MGFRHFECWMFPFGVSGDDFQHIGLSSLETWYIFILFVTLGLKKTRIAFFAANTLQLISHILMKNQIFLFYCRYWITTVLFWACNIREKRSHIGKRIHHFPWNIRHFTWVELSVRCVKWRHIHRRLAYSRLNLWLNLLFSKITYHLFIFTPKANIHSIGFCHQFNLWPKAYYFDETIFPWIKLLMTLIKFWNCVDR